MPTEPHEDQIRLAKRTPGAGLRDHEAQIDMVALRAYRLGRVQAQLRLQDYAAAVLFDPLNIRYATGARQFSLWSARSLARYAFVPAEGKVVLFEYPKPGAMAIARALESCGEVRPAKGWYFFGAGSQAPERARESVQEIADLVRVYGGGNKRVAIDRLDAHSMHALQAHDLDVRDAQEVLERARLIKSAEELACMSISMSVCEAGMARMREALRPGITENRLWSLLHQANIELGGEWIETRLLSSGGRTNPWYQECGDRTIRAGDLVTFDTDLIGPFGYCADVSRSFFCGPGSQAPSRRRSIVWPSSRSRTIPRCSSPASRSANSASAAGGSPSATRPTAFRRCTASGSPTSIRACPTCRTSRHWPSRTRASKPA